MAATNGVNGANGHASTAHVSVDEFLKTDFDYVICGGGTAGLVVAARLSENPDVTVGVIEAGKNKLGDPLVDIPLMFSQMFNNPDYDWAYKTTPQKGNQNKVHHMIRGKMLGGSSGINYMMYGKSPPNSCQPIGTPIRHASTPGVPKLYRCKF